MKPIIFVAFAAALLFLSACATTDQQMDRDAFKREMSRIEKEVERAPQKKPAAEIPAQQTAEDIDAVIAQYELVLKSKEISQQDRLQTLRRLADLYLEQERTRFLMATDRYEQDLARGKKTAPPVQDFTHSIRVYEDLLKIGRDLPDQDKIHYHLASCYDQMGQNKKSIEHLSKVASFPGSPHEQEVLFRLGENYFEEGDFDKAEFYYTKGAQFKSNQIYRWNTLYKLGWTQYLKEEFQSAIDTFRELLDQAQKSPEFLPGGSNAQRTKPREIRAATAANAADSTYQSGLLGDGLQMMARCFCEVGGIAQAKKYFAGIGDRPYRPEVYRGMADYFVLQDRTKEGVAAYQSFLDEYPKNPKALEAYEALVKTYEKSNNFAEAAKVNMALAKFFEPGSSWYGANRDTERRRADQLRESAVAKVAKYNHHLAQHSEGEVKQSAYEQAVKWYGKFVEDFPQSPERETMRYGQAECLYETGRYEEAGKIYAEVATHEKAPDRRVRAALDAFAAYDAEFNKQTREGKKSSMLPHLTQARTLLQQTAPNEPKLADLLLREGKAYFQMKEYPGARVALAEFLKVFPKDPRRGQAVKLQALMDFQEDNFSEAANKARTALSEGSIDEKERTDLLELKASSLFRQSERYEKEKKYLEAAESYLKVAQEEPSSKVAGQALFAAGKNFHLADQGEKGLQAFHELARRYPNDPGVASALQLAADWEKNHKDFSAAGKDYLQAAQASKNPEDKRSLLYSAGMAFNQAKLPQQEIGVWRSLVSVPSTAAQQVEYYHRLGVAEQAAGSSSAALKAHRSAIDLNAKSKNRESDFFAAKSRVSIGDFYQSEFDRVDLVPPFEKNLKRKQDWMEKSIDAYAQAAEIRDVEVSTQATYQIGRVLEKFALALKRSPAPKNLNEKERESYRYLLEEKAFPFEEKAIQSYEANIRTARKSRSFTLWVQKTFERLQIMLPARYAKMEILPSVSNSTDPAVKADFQRGISALKTASYSDAASIFSKAVSNQPAFSQGYHGLGLAQRNLGQYLDAESAYQAALRYDKKNVEVFYNLGILYEIYLDRPKESLRYYREYLALRPNDSRKVSEWIKTLEQQLAQK